MKRIWPYLYLSLAAVAFIGGTGLLGNDHGRTSVDWAAVVVSLLVGTAYPYMVIAYVRSRSANPLPHSSLYRGFSGGLQRDPWQCLFLITLLLCSWFLGTLTTLSHASPQGMMMVWWSGAAALGFVVGGAIARRRFRSSGT